VGSRAAEPLRGLRRPRSLTDGLHDAPVPAGLGRLAGVVMLRPLAIRDFALLWAGVTFSLFGMGIYLVALAWQVYELSNSPTALSVVGFAWSVPMLAFLLGGGVVSDRVDRRRVMIAGDLVRVFGIGAMGVLSVIGVLELWHVVVFVVFEGVGEALFGPSFGAIVPELVPGELLVQANSLNQFVEPLGIRLLGPAAGGAAIAAFGTGTAFLITAATFLVSALAVWLIRTRRELPKREEGASTLHDIAEGFRFVRAHVWLWGTLVSAALGLLLFVGPYEVLVPYIVKNELAGGADDLGFVFAAGGVGAVLAALVTGQRGLPRRHITFMYLTWGTLDPRPRRVRRGRGALARDGCELRGRRVVHGGADCLVDADAAARTEGAARPRFELRLVRLGKPHSGLVRHHGANRGRNRPAGHAHRSGDLGRSSDAGVSLPAWDACDGATPGVRRPHHLGERESAQRGSCVPAAER
jgi:MFS family permease